MATIKLENLVKAYDDLKVLHNLNGEINDGELIVVVGPSGCGKSTLLRMVAGLETITSGYVYIGDNMVNELEPADRDIAMVFQNYALYPHMSVRQNMAYGLKIRKIDKDEINRRVNEAADILGISEFLERKPRQLSGGQRQRVAMGRAIVRDPQVFLFDEPLSNLDAKLRVQMRLEIRKLQQRLKVTSIYVTHDQVEAMTLGDRLMVLNDGAVEQFGTPIELYDKPQTLFVAGFIGSPAMNFIQAQYQNASLYLCSGTEIFYPEIGAEFVTVGIRPEHFEPNKKGDLQIVVQMVEQLGANSLIHGVLENTNVEIVVSLPGHIIAEAGSKMSFSVKDENIHVFDSKSGKRVGK